MTEKRYERQTWKPIPGHPGYEAGSLGDIRSFHKPGGGLGEIPRPLRSFECKGRLAVNLLGGEPRRNSQRFVAAVVLSAFGVTLPRGRAVRHRDGNPLNCRLRNLAVGEHGGSRRPSPDVVEAIRADRAAGLTYAQIGAKHNRGWSVIRNALRRNTPASGGEGERWKAVPWLRRYQVSDLGRARKFQGAGAAELDPFFRSGAMRVYVLNHHGEQTTRPLGAMVLEAFGTFPPDQLSRYIVAYLDGDPRNCRLDNLAWVKG